ncbi:MAG: polyprenyl synthetase family protein [Hyphomicrobiales bacterium]
MEQGISLMTKSDSPMHEISFLTQEIKKALKEIVTVKEPQRLYEPIEYTLNQGGKRLRPLLALISCEMFSGAYSDALYPAIALEMFHNFTLIHDDIMDDAPVRRGQPTVYRKWNQNIAILSGDALFASAFQTSMRTNTPNIKETLDLLCQTAIEVCEGQQYDMDFETQEDVSIKEYIRMIKLKTAVLVAASLKTGAIIAGAPKEQADLLYNYGINIGLAFQLKDDWLDVFSDEVKFGKVNGNDIVTNKKTFLYLKAFEIANGGYLEELKKFFNPLTQHDSVNKVKEVTKIYRDLNISEIVEAEINNYYTQAIASLDAIDVPEERKIFLREFAEKLRSRDH